jgi:HSP20 family protein
MPFSAWEDEDKVHVEVDVPGMTEKDIEVTFHQGQVVIRGERRSPDRSSGYDSRLYGRFEQRLALPQGVQADQAEARLAHGVLCLSFPKAEEARPKRIALKQQ